MPAPPVPPPPAPVTLVVGDDGLLTGRAVGDLLAGLRAQDSAAEVREVLGGSLIEDDLIDLATPSMFGDRRALVVWAAQDLSESVRDELAAALPGVPDDVCLVLVHNGGVKGKRLLEAAKAAGATTVACPTPSRPQERLEFVQAEVRRAGNTITAGACRALVDTVGTDLRELSAAAAQVAVDTEGTVDEDAVARYHRGRAETTGFAVSDAAVAGDAPGALALLTSALDTGTAPVLVVSALASGLRDVIRVRSATQGASSAGLAKALGMPPWKVDRTLRLARGWSDGGLADAVSAVAVADARVKGAGVDVGYALERAVLSITDARHRSA